ncbi:MBOAT family O-acyltransferase [Mycoplasmatota bacterium WC44]
MLFSSISFLFYFLPVILILYFTVPKKYKNFVLLIGSLFFYSFGEPKYVVLLLFSTTVDYIHGIIIDNNRGNKKAKMALISSIVINVSMLAFFKYSDFFIMNVNSLLNTDIKLLGLKLPIGISFYTFQTMSYSIDVYRGEAEVQRNPLRLATYVALFPQLIAGPIVRYKTIAEEINDRTHSYDNFAYGVSRFVLGLSKKVLIANALGELNMLVSNTNTPSVLFYWIGAIAFSLQIYFDFSGYSDMAIGLGKIFGFNFLENFNYPYISKSISEFWNRWHISLGTWFKDYVYIPLGGNRVKKVLWYRNIFIIWFLTGFWHGASWNFIVWGLYFGVILVMEKLFLLKFLDKLPNIVRHLYVVLIVVVSFVIFNIESMSDSFMYIKGMFGLLDVPLSSVEALYYLKSYSLIILVAFVGATPLMKNLFSKENKITARLEPAFYLLLMVLITAYLVDSSFNPFLYFRF